ncbi:MAG TPA: TonB-dependent receptor, partial [Chitinophagaceae bacterium]|nr:TonB-dependent receptor [Chitinophagaceae bacterium]
MKRTLLLLLFLSAVCLGSAQTRRFTLTGQVTDAQTGAPLPRATVLVEDARLGTQTDSAGGFRLRSIPAGHHLVEISHTGYGTVVAHVDISGDLTLNIPLSNVILEHQGVTVTGVSNATSIRRSPVPVTVMRRTDLLRIPSTNIVDALSRQPGVDQLSSGPAVSKPVIRGLSGNRVVVISDGVRQEGQQWGEEHGLELDEASVQKAEIVKGPASLMYGSDALGGVVNLVSNVPVPEGGIRGNVLANYQTNNRMYTAHASLGGNRGGFNWNLYGTRRSAGDYRNRYDGRVLNSRFGEKNFGGYLGLNRGWGYSHLLFASFNQELGMVEGDRDPATGRFVLFAGTPMERIATGADLKEREPQTPYQSVRHRKIAWDNSINWGGSRLKWNIGFQNNRRQEFGNPEDLSEAELYFDLNTVTGQLHWVLPEMRQWRTTLGVGSMRQQNRNRGEEAIIPDYHFTDAGAFLFTQGMFQRFTVSGGLRLDNRNITGAELMEGSERKFVSFTKSFFNVSGSAGIAYEPSAHWTLKANIARGFRAPSLAELASNGAHEGTERYEYGSLSLRSERSLQGDASAELHFEHFSFGVNGFLNRISDYIYYRKLPAAGGGDSLLLVDGEELTAFRFEQDDARLGGFELNLDLHPHPLDWLHFENRVAFIRGRYREPVEGITNMALVPASRWMSELRGNFDRWGSSLRNIYGRVEAEHSFAQQRPFTAYGTETATPAYTLFHASVGADISKGKQTLFSLHLAVQNLTDKAYQNHLSRLKYTGLNEATGRAGVFNMGRNFSLKVN